MHYNLKTIAKITCLASAVLFLGCDRKAQQPNFDQTLTQAESYLLSGQIQSAVIEGQNLLRIKPQSPEALRLLGDVYFAAGDYKNSAQNYKQSLDQLSNTPTLIRYIESLTRIGKLDEAIASLEALREDTNNETEALRLEGNIALTNGKLEKAIQLFTAATEIDPNHSESLLGLAKAHQLQGNSKTSLDWLNQAIASKADFVDALLFKGFFLLGSNEPARAEESFSQALAGVGKYDVMTSQKYQAIQGLAKSYVDQGRTEEALRLNKTLADSPQGKVQQAIKSALEAYQDGDNEKAQENFERVLQIAPGHQLSNLGLGMIKLKEGDINTAEHLLSQASDSDLSTINEQTFKALTLARLQLGKQDAALDILTIALQRFPDSADLRLLKANTMAVSGDIPGSIETLDKLIQEDASNPDALHLKAQLMLNEGDLSAAQTLFQKTLQARPDFFPAYAGLFQSYREKPVQAKQFIQELLKSQKPAVPATELALGVAHSITGQPKKAEDIARKLLKDSPTDKMVKNLLGSSLYDQASKEAQNDRLQSAYIKIKEAVKVSPRDRNITLLTRLAVELQRPDEAVSRLQELVKERPKFGLGHELLSDLMIASNNQDAAIESIKKAWAVEPTYRRGIKLFRLNYQPQEDPKDLEKAMAHLISWEQTAKAQYTSAESNQKKQKQAVYESSLFALSSVYEQHGFEMKAIEIYSQLIEIKPESALYLNNIAWLKFTKNQEGALEHARKAYELAPQAGEIIDTYAWILVQTGETAKGLKLLKLASEKSPNNPMIQKHLEQAIEMQAKSI